MIKIEIWSADKATMTGPFPFPMLKIINALSGRKLWSDGQMKCKIEATPANLALLRSTDYQFEFVDKIGVMDEQQIIENMPTQHDTPDAIELEYVNGDVEPYPHQEKAVALSWMREYYALLFDVGLGKTAILIWTAALLWLAGKITAVLVLAPKGVHRQWVEEEIPKHLLSSIPRSATLWKKKKINDWHLKTKKHLAFFCMNTDAIRTKDGMASATAFLKAHAGKAMFIVDECFPSGTLVDGRQIETIKIGDLVDSSFGKRKVARIFKGKSELLVAIRLKCGKIIRSTPSHPFFTDVGWVQACDLENRVLFDANSTMRLVRKEFQSELEFKQKEILRHALFSELENVSAGDGSEIEPTFKINQHVKDDEGSRGKCQTLRSQTREAFIGSPQGCDKSDQGEEQRRFLKDRRKWEGASEAASFTSSKIEQRLVSGICHHIAAATSRLSELLQSRFRQPENALCNRNRWLKSWFFSRSSKRQEERRQIGGTRVESVTIEKQIRPVDVYNLEVEGCPHYFAEGFLVHNSHDFKTQSSDRTRSLYELGELASYRRIATGTPITKNIVDAWAQFNFLDWRILGHKYLTSFMVRHCITISGGQIVGQKNTEEFYSKIAPHSFRLTKAEALDLPPVIYVTREYEMSEETERHYKALKADLLTEMDNGSIIDAKNPAVALLRLHQVVCGHLPEKDEEGKLVKMHRFGGERIKAMMEIVDQVSGPIVIWARFTDDRYVITEALKKAKETFAVYEGSDDVRAGALAAFMSGKKRIFISNPKSGGVGLNLQGACQTAIYFSNSFAALERWQSEGRLHRIGTLGAVTNFDIVARGTVDRSILRNLKAKKDLADLTLDDIRKAIVEN
jgi:hypothetical protein